MRQPSRHGKFVYSNMLLKIMSFWGYKWASITLVSALLLMGGITIGSSLNAKPANLNIQPTSSNATNSKATQNPQQVAQEAAPQSTVPAAANSTSTPTKSKLYTPPASTSQSPSASYLAPDAPINQASICNQASKAAAQNKHDTAVAYENSRHQNFHPTAPPDSSYYGNQIDQENALHQNNLAQIDYQYQQDLIGANCSSN